MRSTFRGFNFDRENRFIALNKYLHPKPEMDTPSHSHTEEHMQGSDIPGIL